MFSQLTPLQSFDPVEILRLVYKLLFGGTSNVSGGAADWATRTHIMLLDFFRTFTFYLINLFAKYAVFSLFLSIALILLIVLYEIRRIEMKNKLLARVLPVDGAEEEATDLGFVENPKWQLVEEHINSDDPNKWKLAILEADIVLSELLDSLNLPGSSIGDKLKAVEDGDFDHIEEAWEGHKIRNAIAHQGSDFLLTQREAKRVIRLYKSVFEEFKII